MTRAGRTLAAIGAAVALGGAVAGGVGVLLSIGSDVGVVRADVARHERVDEDHERRLRVVEQSATRFADLVQRLDEITRRLERLEPRHPWSSP